MTTATPSFIDNAAAADDGRELQVELSTAANSWEAQEQAYRDFRVNLAKEERKEMAAKVCVLRLPDHILTCAREDDRSLDDLSDILDGESVFAGIA